MPPRHDRHATMAPPPFTLCWDTKQLLGKLQCTLDDPDDIGCFEVSFPLKSQEDALRTPMSPVNAGSFAIRCVSPPKDYPLNSFKLLAELRVPGQEPQYVGLQDNKLFGTSVGVMYRFINQVDLDVIGPQYRWSFRR